MHVTDTSSIPLLIAFAMVVGTPLVTLTMALMSGDASKEAPSPREPLLPDAAYPSTWLALGWNRKYLKAPLSCNSLMELYTTSVRYLRERDWNNALLYSERCLTVLREKSYSAPELEANIANNIGVVAFYSNADKAREQFESSLAMAQSADEQITIASVARNLASVLLFKRDLEAAKAALKISEAAIIQLYGTNARELVDIECLQKAIDRAAGKKVGRR